MASSFELHNIIGKHNAQSGFGVILLQTRLFFLRPIGVTEILTNQRGARTAFLPLKDIARISSLPISGISCQNNNLKSIHTDYIYHNNEKGKPWKKDSPLFKK